LNLSGIAAFEIPNPYFYCGNILHHFDFCNEVKCSMTTLTSLYSYNDAVDLFSDTSRVKFALILEKCAILIAALFSMAATATTYPRRT